MEEIGRTFSIRIPNTMVGVGTVSSLAGMAGGFGAKKAIIVTDAELVEAGLLGSVKKALDGGGIAYVEFDRCLPDAPYPLVEECAKTIKEKGCDLVIAVGGGSVMDLAKVASIMAASEKEPRAVFEILGPPGAGAALPRIPRILIPTTAGTGSEWSGAAVVTDTVVGAKKIIWDTWSEAAIIDPLMTLNLPRRITAETGMDAFTHGLEAFVSWKANVVSDMFAEKTIQLVADNLRIAAAKGSKHMEARYNLALAAAFGMIAGSSSGLGAAHAMSYPLAKKVSLSHGAGVTLLLPAVMEFNLPANPTKFALISELMGEDVEGLSEMEAARKSVKAVRELIQDVNLPLSLRDVGIQKGDIPLFVDFLFKAFPIVKELNPRDITPEEATKIYEEAL